MTDSSRRFSVSTGSAFMSATGRASCKVDETISTDRKFLKNKTFSMTIDILDTYTKCNPNFRVVDKLPQRVLTNPSEGVANNGADNEEANLICRVHDQIICSHTCYTILDLLGTGTFGQVFRCQKDGTKEVVAIKIIKNKAAYHSQGLLEIKIARLLNNTFDPKDERHIVRLLDSFEFNNHICLVFELLSMSLLDILTQNQFRGLPLSVVQRFTRQIIAAMVTLEDANIIHCDLKPENILLAPPKVQKNSALPPVKRKSDEMSLSSSGAGGSGSAATMTKMAGKNGASSLIGGSSTTKKDVHNQSPNPTTPPPALTLSSGSGDRGPETVGAAIVTPDISATQGGTEAADGSDRPVEGGGGERPQTQSQISQGQGQGGRLSVWSDVKVIDLGSACFEGRTMYSYIQSRFYRSPEVLLGVPYNGAIDMWSLACVCAEMYLGLPLFPGVSQHNQLTRIIEMMGYPPDSLIEGKNGSKYFSKGILEFNSSNHGSHQSGLLADVMSNPQGMPKDLWKAPNPPSPVTQKYRLKTAEEYALETSTEIPILRKYLRYSKLDDVIMKCPLANKARMSADQKKEEMLRRLCFLNFLEGLFKMNPFERWTAKQAANHPFITNAVFTGQFIPAVDPKINERKLAYFVQTQQKETRSRNNSGHGGSTAGSMDSSSDDMHVFRPLQFRRLSEPLKMSLAGLMEKEVGGSGRGQGPSLQRGQSVRETDSISSPVQSQIQYQHQSLPYNNGQYMQQQQYLQRQQVQQQQYAELLQSPPEQYSAYSASTPDGMWGCYTLKDQVATSSSNRELSNSQYIDAIVRASTQAAALSRSRNAASCDDLPLALMKGRSMAVNGADNYEGQSWNTNNFSPNGKDTRVGQGQFPTGTKHINHSQQTQQQQQRLYVQGENTNSNLPYARKLSGSQPRYDNRLINQGNRTSPQSYQQSSSLQMQYQIHEQQQQQQQQQQQRGQNQDQQQQLYSSMNQQQLQQQLSSAQVTYPGTTSESYINQHPRMMAGSMDSSTGSAFEGFGGSMTDVPMMMTDFGQALMRPELDERRRLHSMQPVVGVGGNEQYERQRPGQIWQSQTQQPQLQSFSRQNIQPQSFYSQQQNQQQQQQYNLLQQQQQQYLNQANIQTHSRNQNQRQNQNQKLSVSQERHEGRLLNEASLREQTRNKLQHAASSSDGIGFSTASTTRQTGGGRGDDLVDPARSVSFAPSKDSHAELETHNYVAQLIVASRSSSGFISGTASPVRVEVEIASRPAGSSGVQKSPYKGKGGSGKAVGDVTDILADWDPFFSADDFEVEEEERGQSSDSKKGRANIEVGRSTSAGISDRNSTDDGDLDPDLDESEWRSAGSRGTSADVKSPDLPYRKLV